MKILAIGDLHGKIPKNLPKKNIDLILLTGDFGKADLARKIAFKRIEKENYKPTKKQIKEAHLEIYNSTVSILKKIKKIAPIYFVFGNVEIKDSEIKKENKKEKLNLPLIRGNIKKIKGLSHIGGKIKHIRGISIAGYDYFIENSWIKRFKDNDKKSLKENKKDNEKAKEFFKKLKKVDILLIHQPPYKILDKVTYKLAPKKWRGKYAGSDLILDYIKRKHPRYVICGHIHEAFGEKNIGKAKVINLGMRNYGILEVK